MVVVVAAATAGLLFMTSGSRPEAGSEKPHAGGARGPEDRGSFCRFAEARSAGSRSSLEQASGAAVETFAALSAWLSPDAGRRRTNRERGADHARA